ncbi:MAG: VWA domain-containing protein [Ectothiorhodospiraceae bacterium AqS1]|nr:VWA domain-containing protein [Ectothiorhodospiraceae bacterium AqS1]
MNDPLDRNRIEERLEELVEAALSSRRSARGAATSLAALDIGSREFILHWVGIIARTNQELAYHLAGHAADALKALGGEKSEYDRSDHDDLEAWIITAVDRFDERGLIEAIASLRNFEEFAKHRASQRIGIRLEEVEGVLERFLHGLGGRNLQIVSGPEIYTDTATIYLPPSISRFEKRSDNFALYKAIAGHHWAQVRFGSFRIPLEALSPAGEDPARIIGWFRSFESIRLDACLARTLPGLYRDMQNLSLRVDYRQDRLAPLGLDAQRLDSPDADAGDSLELALKRCRQSPPKPGCYEGAIKPEAIAAVMSERIAKERKEFRKLIIESASTMEKTEKKEAQNHPEGEEKYPDRIHIGPKERADDPVLDRSTLLRFDDLPMPIPDNVAGIAESIVQDLGGIPPDYLEAAGPGRYDIEENLAPPAEKNPDDVWKGVYHEDGAFFYDEWDFERKRYRKDWCVLRERKVHPLWDDFAMRTLGRYRGLVKSIRRSFEALRAKERREYRQPEGDDIDLNACVDAFASMRAGGEIPDRLFTRRVLNERDLAVMMMVDMSGSTKGWINDAEREALVLLCEALETLGDRYAIYGFSGSTRKRCEIYPIKQFAEEYNDRVQARISGIAAQDYTRMGAAIRHLTKITNEIEAKSKILITLSDGKPDDYTDYRGSYGIEDTRMALFEAKRAGIHPFCVTIDTDAGDYLPRMYGTANFIIVNEVRQLPKHLSDIYRKLTS